MHPAGFYPDERWTGNTVYGFLGPKTMYNATRPRWWHRHARELKMAGAIAIGSAVLMAVLCIVGCQPRPCEAQAGQMLQRLAAGAITPGDCTAAQAVQNRLAIESGTSPPANSLVKLDRTLSPVSGFTLDGQGATIQNAFDPTTRTIQARGTGLGYFDTIAVTGANQFTLKDPTVAAYYKPGQPVYLWRLDGFQNPDGVGGLRTLHGIRSVFGSQVNLVPGGPPLDQRLTAAKWFSNAVSVAVVGPGRTQFKTSLQFNAGDYLQLTTGPEIANEGRDEWLRAASTTEVATPVQRHYDAAVLAVAQPITGCTLRNLTIDVPVGPQNWTSQLNYFQNARLDNCTIKGVWSQVGSEYATFTGCTIDNLSLNSCAHFQFIGCSFGTVWLEEGTFDVTFSGCVFQKTFSGNTGIERIHLCACRLLAGLGNFIGLNAPGSTADALELGGELYASGDGWTIRNCRGPVVLKAGRGSVFDSPGAQKLAGNWTVIP